MSSEVEFDEAAAAAIEFPRGNVFLTGGVLVPDVTVLLLLLLLVKGDAGVLFTVDGAVNFAVLFDSSFAGFCSLSVEP